MPEWFWIFLAVIIMIGVLVRVSRLRRVIVYEYQKALRYRRGRYVGTIGPGQYWIFPRSSSIVPLDIRPEFITVQGQDVLSADGVTLKVSLAAEFEVIDPNIATNRSANFRTSLYLSLQMSLREIVGAQKIDAIIDNRAGIGANLMELTAKKATELGLRLISADIKDIMFSGEMKKAFAQVVKAQKEGQAALERARSETAALRSLANAARTMEDNPNLLQLRALQALTDSGGSTLVLGLPNGAIPIARRNERGSGPPKENELD